MSDTAYGYFTVNVPPEYFAAHPGAGKNGDLGYICVRLDRPAKGSDSTKYRASFSFCSPKDAPKRPHELGKPFKTVSKRIADCRMTTTRIKASIEFDFKKNETSSLPDVIRTALDHALKPENEEVIHVPTWCERAKIEYGLMKSDGKMVGEKAHP